MKLSVCPYMLNFRFPAGTSRGVLTEKPTYLLKLYDESNPDVYGLGEAAVFPGLSPEADYRYEYKLMELMANIVIGKPTDLSQHSSIQFGFEQALRDFASGGRGLYFPSEFTEGMKSITINGLVWMGNFEEMHARLEEKIKAGFRCIKIKIGAIDWQQELSLLMSIREKYSPDEVTIRVDANGGFSMDSVLPKLHALSQLGVHSIEQPLPARNPDLMKFLCEVSPVPIALDEELIGVYGAENKKRLLEYIRPAYIILKPALCGGFSGAKEWMDVADSLGIGYWITSALESNVGLNAISQFAATLPIDIPQGLGTGGLYTNNFTSPLHLVGEQLCFDPTAPLDREQFGRLDWKNI